MQDVRILGYLSINFTTYSLKFVVVLLILNSLPALVNLLFVLNFLTIFLDGKPASKCCFSYSFIILSILLINSAASSGLPTFFDKSSTPLLSNCSFIIDSRSLSSIIVLLNLFFFLVSSDPIN